MYEEKKFKNKKVNWISLLIKLVLLFLIVFLIWYIVNRKSGNNNSTKKLGDNISNNIKYLKDQYIKFFKKNDIPTNKNEELKVSLQELIDAKDSKIIYDKNGDKCSSTSSYGKLIKTSDDTYELKVYLKCKDEADSELYSIKYTEIIDTTKNNNGKDNNNNNKSSDDNKSNKDNNNNKSNTSNSNNNSNKSNSSNKNTNTNTNSTTKTNTNKTNTNTNTNTNTSTSSSTSTKTTTTSSSTSTSTTSSSKTTTTSTTSTNNNGSSVAVVEEKQIDVEKITSDPSRIVATEYLLYKLGDPTTNLPKDQKFISYEYKIQYYKYCNNEDLVNCHTGFAKNKANEQKIKDLISYGYTEYPDYTDTVTIYYPIIDEKWDQNKNKEEYIYSGESRTHYRVN